MCRHSGPQGHVKPLTIINDSADWTATSLAGKEHEYSYRLSAEDFKEILQARPTQRSDSSELQVHGAVRSGYVTSMLATLAQMSLCRQWGA